MSSWARRLRLDCPHCGLQAVSTLRKAALVVYGWERPVPCQACGQRVEVRSFAVMAWTAPFILWCVVAAVLLALGQASAPLVLAGAALLAAVALIGLLLGVPLYKRARTDPQAVQRAHSGTR
jgi:hypothetical protein